jgi:hypothetical protein
MHTPISFAVLTTSQQLRYLHQRGTYAEKRSVGEFSYQLFSLHSFFVELCRDRSNGRLMGIYPIPLDLVNAFYAEGVSLEALLD